MKKPFYLSVSNRLLLIVLFFFIAASVGFLELASNEKNRAAELFAQAQIEKESSFDKLWELTGDRVRAYAEDYTYWDDMVKFANRELPLKWGDENVSTGIEDFKVNAAWVYDLNQSLVYFANNIEADDLENLGISSSTFDTLYKNRFIHFFLNTAHGPLEVRGATVHYTSDAERTGEPQGYFFNALLWNDEQLTNLGTLSHATVRIDSLSGTTDSPTTSDLTSGIVRFERTLPDPNSEPLLRLSIESAASAVQEFNRTSKREIEYIAIFLLALLVLLYILLSRFVTKPLQTLVKGLASEDGASLGSITGSSTEFGEVANLIRQSQEQQRLIALAKAKDEALLGSIVDGIVAVDENLKIQFINKAAARMIGWAEELVVNLPISEVIQVMTEKQEESRFDLIVQGSIQKKEVEKVLSVVLQTKDGREVPVEIICAPIRDEAGKITGSIIILHDVTSERELAASKEEFISLATHQMRTPISAIGGYIELMTASFNGTATEDQKHFMSSILHARNILFELVNALLDTYKFELGSIAIEPKEQNLKAVIEDSLKEVTPRIEKKKQHFEFIYDEAIPPLSIDASITRAVFQNLVTNASKYTAEGGSVKLTIKKEDPNILITITDNGYGIPKEQQSKVFKKLFRARNIRVVEPEGTGLGLFIVKAAVDAYGGKVWFESEENKGTTFFVTIPLSGMTPRKGLRGLT